MQTDSNANAAVTNDRQFSFFLARLYIMQLLPLFFVFPFIDCFWSLIEFKIIDHSW